MKKKLLYITANPKGENESYGLMTGREFLEGYQKFHPDHEVEVLDLFKTNVPQLNEVVFSAFGKLQSGVEFGQLSAQEQQLIGEINQLLEQFMKSDRYVVVSPLWNFSVPPVLKAYVDIIMQAGKTFKYTENGPVGLLEDKKALHIQASGGIYSQGPAQEMEFGHRYLKNVLAFIGVHDVDFIPVEGIALAPEKADEILNVSKAKARELAEKF